MTKYPVGVTPPVPAVQLTKAFGAAAAGTVTPVGGLSVPVSADPAADPAAVQYANAGVAAAVAMIAMIASSATVVRAVCRIMDSR